MEGRDQSGTVVRAPRYGACLDKVRKASPAPPARPRWRPRGAAGRRPSPASSPTCGGRRAARRCRAAASPTTANAPRTLAACCDGVGHLALGRALARVRSTSAHVRDAELGGERARRAGRSASPRRADGTVVTQPTGAPRAAQRRRRAPPTTSSLELARPRRPRSIAGHQPPSPKRASAQPGSMRASSGILRIAPAGVGRHLLDLELDRPRAQVALRQLDQRRVGRLREARRRCRPSSARSRAASGSSSSSCSDAHQAAAVGAERGHRLLLGAAQRGDLRVALGVVGPVARRGPRCQRVPSRRTAPSTSRIFSIASIRPMPRFTTAISSRVVRPSVARGVAARRAPPSPARAPGTPAR